jgi:hypothetical protein
MAGMFKIIFTIITQSRADFLQRVDYPTDSWLLTINGADTSVMVSAV